MDATARFYSQPTYVGGGYPVFSGSRRQRGGGVFGSLFKVVAPTLKTVLRKAGSQALGLAGDVAKSALSGEGLAGMKRTFRRQGIKRLKSIGRDTLASARGAIGMSMSNAVKSPRKKKRRRKAAIRAISSTLRKRRNTAAGSVQAKRRRRGAGSGVVLNF